MDTGKTIFPDHMSEYWGVDSGQAQLTTRVRVPYRVRGRPFFRYNHRVDNSNHCLNLGGLVCNLLLACHYLKYKGAHETSKE